MQIQGVQSIASYYNFCYTHSRYDGIQILSFKFAAAILPKTICKKNALSILFLEFQDQIVTVCKPVWTGNILGSVEFDAFDGIASSDHGKL